jgi:hypothetical protein
MPEKQDGTIGNFPTDMDKGKSDHEARQIKRPVDEIIDTQRLNSNLREPPSRQSLSKLEAMGYTGNGSSTPRDERFHRFEDRKSQR